MHAVDFGRDVCGDFAFADAREWLVTSGIGGYASGTVDGSLSRTYHGYLIAALAPPGERTLVFAKCDETCTYRGTAYELGTNRWRSGAVEPKGYLLLERFFLDGTTPVWRYAFAGALVEKRLTLRPGTNEAIVRYAVLRATAPVAWSVRALVDWRDHGATSQAGPLPAIDARGDALAVRFAITDRALWLRSDRCVPERAAQWYSDFELVRERERGLLAIDAHVHAATFAFELGPGDAANVSASVDRGIEDLAGVWRERAEHEAAILRAARPASPAIAQLVLAADQFVVGRAIADDTDGRTIIAGYPWFTDWGRDTTIALPGLLIATGRLEVARSVLVTFARYIDGGMLPNVFPDRGGEPPQYNTVDAALWYVEAVRSYVAAAGIDDAFDTLYAACVAIVTGYRSGTRYGIHMDPADGLVTAGVPGVQVTWMDAIADGVVVTPRIGKPVEINALWYNALRILADLTRRRGRVDREYGALAARVRAGFERYALEDGRGLADVLDGPDGDDRTLRPNQIFAAALEYTPLSVAAVRGVVDACATSLVTSHGLRTRAPGDPNYIGAYAGNPVERDRAYHQGTVWPWLLPAFVRAHRRAYGDRSVARTFLEPLLDALDAGGLGTIGEIADGDAPFVWRGAIAQAWSVGTLLAALAELDD